MHARVGCTSSHSMVSQGCKTSTAVLLHVSSATNSSLEVMCVDNACPLHHACCQVVAGDLDAPATLAPHLSRVGSVYCHALSGDASAADPAELARGRALAQLLAGHEMQLVVYNSSAGRGSNAGISQVGGKSCMPTCTGAHAHALACLWGLFDRSVGVCKQDVNTHDPVSSFDGWDACVRALGRGPPTVFAHVSELVGGCTISVFYHACCYYPCCPSGKVNLLLGVPAAQGCRDFCTCLYSNAMAEYSMAASTHYSALQYSNTDCALSVSSRDSTCCCFAGVC